MAGKSKPQRRSLRYWLEQVHLWTGLILLLPLVMMGITGAVLMGLGPLFELDPEPEAGPSTIEDDK